MKKFLALMLVLCMALAAIPALAETDFTGTWYLITIGQTAGIFELNADGTCAATLYANTEEQKMEGTWSADGDVVTITAQEQALPMTFDGTDLILGEAALTAFGGSSIPEGMDISMFSSLIKFSREPGKITTAELNAYNNDGTIPEGKTKEDMDAAVAEMQVMIMSLLSGMGVDLSGAAGQDTPEAALPLTVVEENFYVRKSWGDNLEGCYIAKVANENDSPLSISDALLILKDADGNEVGRTEYLGRSGSRYLEPGEASFVSIRADVAEGSTVATYEASFGTSANSYGKDTQIEASNAELRVKEGYWTTYYVAATITNASDAPLSQASVVIALKDSEGKLLDLATSGLYQNELAAGSTITLIDSIDSSTVDYCTENGIQLGGVEAFGWVESNE